MQRHTTALLALGCASLICEGAGAAPAKDPSATWLTEDGRARVRVERCKAKPADICGYVVWLAPRKGMTASTLDKNNPDPAKASFPVLGHQLMNGLTLNEDGEYEGLIYNADNGKSYDVTVWRESPDELKVKGCLIALLCKTQSWKQVDDVVPGQLTGATGAPGGPRSGTASASQPSGPTRRERKQKS